MKKLPIVFVVIFVFLISCKKSGDQPSDNIVGRWKWVYSEGGLGVVSRPAVGDKEHSLILNSDSTYSFAEDNAVYDAGIFHTGIVADAVSKEKFHAITFKPSREKASSFTNYLVMKNDTLTLSTTFTWEGSHSMYTRK